MRRLEGKVIAVAGAGGIGNELARRYASEGACVVLGDADGAKARDVAAEIAAGGGTATGTQLDGADDVSIKAFVDLAVSTYGGLDGFHANYASFADGAQDYDVLTLPMETWDETMRVNMRGYVLCTRHALPALIARGGGSIVYTSSSASVIGEPVRVAYAMGKASLHALMRHVASRFGPQGIRANAIAPGVVLHERLLTVMSPEFIRAAEQTTLFGNRVGTPADIAAMGALLMSDDGAFVTGQVIGVDGGGTMRP